VSEHILSIDYWSVTVPHIIIYSYHTFARVKLMCLIEGWEYNWCVAL